MFIKHGKEVHQKDERHVNIKRFLGDQIVQSAFRKEADVSSRCMSTMVFLRALQLALLAAYLHITQEVAEAFDCKSNGPYYQYVTDAEVDKWCNSTKQPPYNVMQNPSMAHLISDVLGAAVVLHSKIDRVFTANVTWTGTGCRLTAKRYFITLENLCIFKNYDYRINPDYKPISRYLKVESWCPLGKLTKGLDLLVISSTVSVDNMRKESVEEIGVPQISLSYLYKSSEKVLQQTAKVCGMENAKIAHNAPEDGRHVCPSVTINDVTPCVRSAAYRVYNPWTLPILVLAISCWTYS